VLTATDQKPQKSLKKVTLPTITSPKFQRDAEQYDLLMIFAVFDPSPLTLWINCIFSINNCCFIVKIV